MMALWTHLRLYPDRKHVVTGKQDESCVFICFRPEIPTIFVCCLQQRTPSQLSTAYGKHVIALAEAGDFSYAAAHKAWVDADQSNRAALRDLICKREKLEGSLREASSVLRSKNNSLNAARLLCLLSTQAL